jgi:hypothetical protein
MLSEGDRRELAIQALARSATICDLSDRHGVSRKFVSQQAHKACSALDNVFWQTRRRRAFPFAVTKAWLRQVIVALPLICHSSYRGVIEFLRDLLGIQSAWAPFTMCFRRRRLCCTDPFLVAGSRAATQ